MVGRWFTDHTIDFTNHSKTFTDHTPTTLFTTDFFCSHVLFLQVSQSNKNRVIHLWRNLHMMLSMCVSEICGCWRVKLSLTFIELVESHWLDIPVLNINHSFGIGVTKVWIMRWAIVDHRFIDWIGGLVWEDACWQARHTLHNLWKVSYISELQINAKS